MKYLLCLLFCCTFLGQSCEDTTTIVYPVSNDQLFTFVIDGQPQELLVTGQQSHNTLRVAINSQLRLRSSNSDESLIFDIQADNIPMENLDKGAIFMSDGFIPATITVSGRAMEGGVYCPHPVSTESVIYAGLIRWDSYGEDGIMKGQFKTADDDTNVVTITDGRFELIVRKDV